MNRAAYIIACAVPAAMMAATICAIAVQALRIDPYPSACAGYAPSDCTAAAEIAGGW